MPRSERFGALRAVASALVLSACALGAAQVRAAATIVINNINAANVGFNDPTPATPLGGNTGTTLGQQRLIAFTYAANLWGATLTSNVPIVINAQMTGLTCTSSSATLGSAGATSVFRDFAGAQKPATWYSYALANKLSGSYQGTANAAQISANFNVNLGNTGCLDGQYWYLGLDNNHGNNIDFITVLLHEMGHGLGFQTFTNGSTGAFNGGYPSIWDWYLYGVSAGKLWKDMSNAERAASALSVSGLVWTGPGVSAAVPTVLGPKLRLQVITPVPGVARDYDYGTASYGPAAGSPALQGKLGVVVDQGAGPGCDTFNAANKAAVTGRIAIIDRGTCAFAVKTRNAQDAGAIGVVIANNAAGSAPGLGGSDSAVTIPTVSVSQADGVTLKAAVAAASVYGSRATPGSVIASLFLDPSRYAGADLLGRAMLYAPNPFVSGSSVSHFDISAFPNQLMEPNINGDLTHSVIPPQDMTFTLLQDIGW